VAFFFKCAQESPFRPRAAVFGLLDNSRLWVMPWQRATPPAAYFSASFCSSLLSRFFRKPAPTSLNGDITWMMGLTLSIRLWGCEARHDPSLRPLAPHLPFQLMSVCTSDGSRRRGLCIQAMPGCTRCYGDAACGRHPEHPGKLLLQSFVLPIVTIRGIPHPLTSFPAIPSRSSLSRSERW
jgi:hypothetical protein